MEQTNTKASLTYATLRQTAIDTVMCHTDRDLLHDPSLLSRTLTPTCKRLLVPSSFGQSEGLADIGFTNAKDMIQGLDNVQYETEVSKELPNVDAWDLEITDVLVDETKRAATVWGRYFVAVKGGEKFTLEFIQMLHIEETSDKVQRIIEFVDTATIGRWDSAMKQAAKRQQGV